MAKIELSLKRTYRPHWGKPEAVREFVQNWLDGHDKGFDRSVRREGDWLVLRNEQVVLPREALLLGFTTKATDGDARGQWGEGLDMGLLVAARAGMNVKVFTGAERWVSEIRPSTSFNDEVLTVFTRQVRDCGGTEVYMEISEEDWEDLQWRFLELRPAETGISSQRGQLIFDPSRRGCVYVKGIFVSRLEGMEHGYNFEAVRVDMDRMLVNSFDVSWEAGLLWCSAVEKEPDVQGPVVWKMLKAEKKDAEGIEYHAKSKPEVAAAIAMAFEDENGPGCLPVTDDRQAQKMEHMGRKPVRVSHAAAKVLEPHYGGFHEIMARISHQEKTNVAIMDLTDGELEVICYGIKLVSRVVKARTYMELVAQFEVVEYSDKEILGTWDRDRKKCSVARKTLVDVPEFLETYIHELSHDLSCSGEGDLMHVALEEWIWSHVCRLLIERTGLDWLDGGDDEPNLRDMRQSS